MNIIGWIGFAFFIALNALDALLTAMILNLGGKEKNPVMRWFIGKIGNTLGLGVPKLIVSAVVGWILYSAPELWFLGPIFAFMYAYICKRNYYVLTLLK